VLDQVLPNIPRLYDPNLIVGFDKADDAGVYKLSPECALVQTVDFFTPIVDDPYTFGAIAAANSLSDVYAMGGRPITALSILCYPGDGSLPDLEAILRGGADKLIEAGCVLAGGHSVKDDEIKFGYSVTGIVHPDRVMANASAQVGDWLVLTKPIGTGVISTALKQNKATIEHVEAAIASMTTLNKTACEQMVASGAHGCTDITGFGLLGHAREMALGSNVTLEIEANAVPLLAGALDYARAGAIAGGLKNNRAFVACDVAPNEAIDEALYALLCDPQTSGGLLVATPNPNFGTRIGRVLAKQNKAILIQ
jgi:selenide, water dikinase